MRLTDLRELKTMLEIDLRNTSEDKLLNFLIEWASEWIEEILNRPLTYKSRTEYYRGTNTSQLTLRARPVFTSPALDVRVDNSGYYGAASGSFGSGTVLEYGVDYALKIDADDGASSRSGILLRLKGAWPRPFVRQTGLLASYLGEDTGSIRVTYTAGYTPDTIPSTIRAACNLLVARMRYVIPIGMEIGSDSYEERSIGIVAERKDYLTALVKPMLHHYRNLKW